MKTWQRIFMKNLDMHTVTFSHHITPIIIPLSTTVIAVDSLLFFFFFSFLYRLCLVILLPPIHFRLKSFHLTFSGAISTHLTEVFQRLDGFSSAVLDLTLTAEDAALLLGALVDFSSNLSREDVGKTIQRLGIFSEQQPVFFTFLQTFALSEYRK